MSDYPQPSFVSPPVVETVYGVQFDPLPKFTNAHLGAFWHELGRARWPDVADAPLLPHEHERFGDERQWAPWGLMRLAIRGDEASRVQVRNAAGDRMVQAQNGRFLYNWIQREGRPYPGNNVVRPEFDVLYEQFRAFAESLNVGPVKPNQWEVTYVNHFPKGTVWKSPQDWPAIFDRKLVQPPESLDPLALESVGGSWRYVIPDNKGRLHVELVHGRTDSSPKATEVLILKLTARGPVDDAPGGLDAGLALGHDVVVGNFKRLTSAASRAHWGERNT